MASMRDITAALLKGDMEAGVIAKAMAIQEPAVAEVLATLERRQAAKARLAGVVFVGDNATLSRADVMEYHKACLMVGEAQEHLAREQTTLDLLEAWLELAVRADRRGAVRE